MKPPSGAASCLSTMKPQKPSVRYNVQMQSRSLVWLGLTVGSTIGGFVPELWGASLFSFSSVVLTAVGGLAGIWVGYKLTQGY